MELDDLATLIRTRRSIRRWQDKEVPLKLLIKAIELATWAPNGGNRQNWRFYIIVDRNMIKSIADETQNSADRMLSWPEAREFSDEAQDSADRMASWPEAKEFENEAAKSRERISFFRSAPAAIAVAAARYNSIADEILAAREKTDPLAGQMRVWRGTANTRIQSVASAIAYLLLVLHQMSLGAVWMTGPLQAAGKLEEILRIPSNMDLVAFIPVGYPDESPDPRPRRPVEEVYEIVSSSLGQPTMD